MPFRPFTTEAPAPHHGRPPSVTRLGPTEARQEALYLIRQGLFAEGTKMRGTIQLLSTAGVLPGQTLRDLAGLAERTVRRYRQIHLLDRIEVPEKLHPIYPAGTLLYALGPVGQMVGEILYDLIPIGYVEAKQDRVTHDLLCNLVVCALCKGLKPLGYQTGWYSKYEATIHDKEGRPLLEPDAMVIATHPTKPSQTFLIEYHHEDFGSRAEGKVLKYERLLRDHRRDWQPKWQTEVPPTILVVWNHTAVGTGYRTHFEGRRRQTLSVQGRWLGKPLRAFLDKQTVLLWENLGTGQPQDRLLR